MRIAFLILNLGSGGAERTTTTLSSCMAQEGHDVTIFSMTGNQSFYPVDEKVNLRFLQMPELPNGNKISRVTAIVKRAKKLRKIIKKENPDVLIGMSHIMSAYAAFCTAGTGIRSVGTERANPFVLQASTGITILRKVASVLCTGFVAQTKKALSFFPKSVQKKAVVIPNAVFNPLAVNAEVPAERNNEITAVGRLDYNKGFDVLIDAFHIVHKSHPEMKLIIHGEGPDRDKLENKIRKMGLTDFISLPGASPEAILNVSKSSVFVLSSRSEGMPNALIEAMAVGTPCVSTDCDMGPAELINNGINGILVPKDNPEQMADAILRLLNSKELSAGISQNALHIRQTNSVNTIAERWITYFGTLLT